MPIPLQTLAQYFDE